MGGFSTPQQPLWCRGFCPGCGRQCRRPTPGPAGPWWFVTSLLSTCIMPPANCLCFDPLPTLMSLLPTFIGDPNLYVSPFCLLSRKSDIRAISLTEEIRNHSTSLLPEHSMFVGIFYLCFVLVYVRFVTCLTRRCVKVGDVPEGSIALKISSDCIFNPDRPECYGLSHQRGMEQATEAGVSNDIMPPNCSDSTPLPELKDREFRALRVYMGNPG